MSKKFLKENGVYILYYIFLFLLTILLYLIPNYLPEVINTSLKLDKIGKIVTGIVLVLSIIYFWVLKNIDKKEVKIEKIFLIIAIPIGLIYLFAYPLGAVPDEVHHFSRAYEISLGKLVSEQNADGAGGNILPENLQNIFIANGTENSETWFRRASTEKLSENEKFLWYSNTSLYAFISYLPQAIGIFLARIFTENILVLAYSARFFNFISFILLTYFSIKLIPFKKLMVLLIAFLPIVFQEAISLAADTFTTCLTMFFISYILYLKETKKDELLTKWDYIILTILSIMIALVKIIYLPICLLLYILPKEKFKSTKHKYIVVTLIVITSILMNLLWLGFASRYLVPFNEGVNPKEQVTFILKHPISYIVIVLRTVNDYIADHVSHILGDLCIYTVSVSWIFKYAILFLLLFAIFADNKKENKINNSTKIIMALVAIAVIALLYTSEYVSWTPVGYNFIGGIQGRYYLPIFILLPFIFDNSYVTYSKKISMRFITTLMFFINLHAVSLVMLFYK